MYVVLYIYNKMFIKLISKYVHVSVSKLNLIYSNIIFENPLDKEFCWFTELFLCRLYILGYCKYILDSIF